MRTYLSPSSGRTRFQRGFTLMELMMVLTIAGVILGLAVPNIRDFIRNNRLSSGANDLLAAFNYARTEAIKRQLPTGGVALCPTADPTAAVPTCAASWSRTSSAFVVWVDTDNDWTPDAGEEVLVRNAALDSSLTLRSETNGRAMYLTSGFSAPSNGTIVPVRNIVLCDIRGTAAVGNASAARLVQITNTGRARVAKTAGEITTALGVTGMSGSTCP